MSAPLTIHMDPDASECTKALGAVEKAMVILAALTTSEESLPLAEVSRRCGLPKATVHRLLATLCAHNMATRFGDKYSAVPYSFRVARQQAGDGTFFAVLRNESTPYLVELHNTTGATATVSALVNGSVAHINQVYGHRGIRVGATSVAVTATDMILQAYDTAHTPHVARDLFEIRRAGIAYVNASGRGVVSLAVPLCDNGTTFQAPAALSIIGRPGGFDPVSASKELRRSAYELTRTIKRSMPVRVAV